MSIGWTWVGKHNSLKTQSTMEKSKFYTCSAEAIISKIPVPTVWNKWNNSEISPHAKDDIKQRHVKGRSSTNYGKSGERLGCPRYIFLLNLTANNLVKDICRESALLWKIISADEAFPHSGKKFLIWWSWRRTRGAHQIAGFNCLSDLFTTHPATCMIINMVLPKVIAKRLKPIGKHLTDIFPSVLKTKQGGSFSCVHIRKIKKTLTLCFRPLC